jgi:hypothetical protein
MQATFARPAGALTFDSGRTGRHGGWDPAAPCYGEGNGAA